MGVVRWAGRRGGPVIGGAALAAIAASTLRRRPADSGTVVELREALARVQRELEQARTLGEIAESLEVDEVAARTLAAASALPGCDAVLLLLRGGGRDAGPLVWSEGLSVEEAAREDVAAAPRGEDGGAAPIHFRLDPQRPRGALTAGIAVRLAADDEPLGYLTVFTRAPDGVLGDEVPRALDALSERAGPAIENARRYREARRLADHDGLTGLHNRRYFHETLAREVSRARRYNRALALVVLDLDDFKEVNDQVGHLAGDAVLAEAAGCLRSVVRSADIACRVGGDEFAVVLPESTLADADGLYRRIAAALETKPPAAKGVLRFSAGVAELRPGDDAASLFQRADDALYRAKESGKGRMAAASA